MSQQNQSELPQFAYCVVRYGQILAVYTEFDDAAQVEKNYVAKGQVCDVIVKPLIYKNDGQK